MTALAEELLFRGLLLGALLGRLGTSRRGIYQATIATSVTFGQPTCSAPARSPALLPCSA